jgi:hypothetical protein
MDLLSKLNKGLKFGAKAAPSGLLHENEVAILDAAKQLLNNSAHGRELLDYAAQNGVKLHVLRGTEKFGFFPEDSAVYVSCPAGQRMPELKTVLLLAGALREAMLERENGLKRPTPAIGRERFIATQTERDVQITGWQVLVGYEIFEATGLREIIDVMESMGYASLIEAHKLDLEAKTSND